MRKLPDVAQGTDSITNTVPSGVLFIVAAHSVQFQADFRHKILFFGKDAKVFLKKRYFCWAIISALCFCNAISDILKS